MKGQIIWEAMLSMWAQWTFCQGMLAESSSPFSGSCAAFGCWCRSAVRISSSIRSRSYTEVTSVSHQEQQQEGQWTQYRIARRIIEDNAKDLTFHLTAGRQDGHVRVVYFHIGDDDDEVPMQEHDRSVV